MTKVISEAKQDSARSSAPPQVKLRSLRVNQDGVHVKTPGQTIQPGGSLGETTRKERKFWGIEKMREKICLFEMDEFLLMVEFEN